MGHANMVDRIELAYYDPLVNGAVTVFTDLYCQNWAGRLDASLDPEQVMYYNKDDLQM